MTSSISNLLGEIRGRVDMLDSGRASAMVKFSKLDEHDVMLEAKRIE